MIGFIGLGGYPASGKSTLIRTLLPRLRGQAVNFKNGLVFGVIYPQEKLAVLGSYLREERYPGTDRFSMSVQPDFNRFLQEWNDDPARHGWIVLLEGDRLFNNTTLVLVRDVLHLPHRLFTLQVDDSVISSRHGKRDSQDATWLRGRATKVEHLVKEFQPTVLPNNTAIDLLTNTDTLLQALDDLRHDLSLPQEEL